MTPLFAYGRKKYRGLGVCELRRLKQLEEENRQLKQIVADLSLDKQMLQDVLKKNFEASTKDKRRQRVNRRLQSICNQGL